MQNKEKRYGFIAGMSLLTMAITAGFSYGYVQNSLVVDSPEATFQNLLNHKALFYAGITGWVIIFITDLIVSLALFNYFRKTSRQISLITAILRIIYSLILGIAIFQLFRIIPELFVSLSDINVLAANEVIMLFQLFEKFWSIGLIIFGLHLLGLGYLSVNSKSIPGLLGYLLYLGGVSYTFIHGFRQLALLDPVIISKAENILSLPMALAEILLAFWLIFKRFRKEKVVV